MTELEKIKKQIEELLEQVKNLSPNLPIMCCKCRCNHSCCCEIREGCLVVYTEDAHKALGSIAHRNPRRVKEIKNDKNYGVLVTMEDNTTSNIHWLRHL